MAKYDGWTIGETRKILKMIGGVEIAREVLRGKRKLRVTKTVVHKPGQEPLVGTVIKTLCLKPSKARSVKELIKLGEYTGHRHDEILEKFKSEEVGFAEAVKVGLVRFNRSSYRSEILTWAKKNGNKQLILPKHLFEIGIQHPKEQIKNKLVALGPVDRFLSPILYLEGYSPTNMRDLNYVDLNERFNQYWLFGFLS